MRVITGIARGVALKTPSGMETRPTSDRVKEALFSMIQFEVEGRRVLDLFAGTGQLGIEALSRGAASAVFVDASRDAANLVRENLRRTRLTDCARIVRRDSIAYLRSCHDKFDLILLDPPYAQKLLENALRQISEIDILSDRGIIICERPSEKSVLDPVPGLTLDRERRYGGTLISLYRKDADDAI